MTVTQRPPGLDTSFDRYARLVRRAVGVPVALVTLVEDDRQVFPGVSGLAEPWASARQTPLSHSFCQHVVATAAPFVVTDAPADDRVCDNLAIPDLGVQAYAGWPITDHHGMVVGSLCAIDTEPRDWAAEELAALADLAQACSSELGERGLREQAVDSARQARTLSEQTRTLLTISERLGAARGLGDVAAAAQQVALEQLGCLRGGIWVRAVAVPGAAADLTSYPARSGRLEYVAPPGSRWTSAERNARLPVDGTSPLGDAALLGRRLVYRDPVAQNLAYPRLDVSAQVGGTRAYVPLLVQGQVLGTLALVWPEVRDLEPDLLRVVDALAGSLAQAVDRALLTQERVDALLTLQRSLLPRLPRVEGLEIAARYRAAARRDQVGGDWYDAVAMPSGTTALMIGDVVGHDVEAAATMGQLRTMLRAIAWAVDDRPSANVARLDRAIEELGVGGMASLLYARVEPDADGGAQLVWTNAGHPPPLLVLPDGTTRWLTDVGDGDVGDEGEDEGEDEGDLMLGVLPELERHDHRAALPPGSLLLLYTDGLVERRGEDLAVGLDRLRDATRRHAAEPLEALVDLVLGELTAGGLTDDVAVLAVRLSR